MACFRTPWLAAGVLLLLALPGAASPYSARCSVDPGEALRRINAARASGQRCGGRSMPPAPPLRWSGALQDAAAGHSRDMARRNYFGHRSPEGRTVAERTRAARYSSKFVGENLAGGDRTVGGALQGWVDSPDHCVNLMNARYAEVAVACVGDARSQWGTYWTMVLGRR
jgi:uncharacterized protein YkwD